ncbi:hypothetical protein K438DRAFT_1972421 [Mycena galopus ATCC 62051]|nr:hypothetical protein K438DRAFT_1972421 [Mycena galopus ATCC 62051]
MLTPVPQCSVDSLCTYRGPLAFSSETDCAGAVHRPYSDASGFLPRDSAYLSSEAAYEHDPFAKGGVRVVHRSCEARVRAIFVT